ncbi:MAG TPA: hypothetical protein VEU77_07660 [Candidatus Acidoferrales bacterium]|nr:hypothetical protein [Candidatus Acidoferrales bacterium]
MKTGRIYPAKAAAGRDLAHLVAGDPKDNFVWFKIARTFPERFLVEDEHGDWVTLDDASAPVGTLYVREDAPHQRSESGTRLTTLEVDERKLEMVKTALGTRTLRDTVDRAFDEVLVRAARAETVERLKTMDGLDLDKRSVMEKAWR